MRVIIIINLFAPIRQWRPRLRSTAHQYDKSSTTPPNKLVIGCLYIFLLTKQENCVSYPCPDMGHTKSLPGMIQMLPSQKCISQMILPYRFINLKSKTVPFHFPVAITGTARRDLDLDSD